MLRLIFICLMVIPLGGYANEPFFPKLNVNGSAILYKPANQLTMSISVVTQGVRAEEALSANNEKMQKVIASLLQIGLKKGEYQTGKFNIQPVYSVAPKNPPPDWKPTINGYDVTNTLTIRTEKLDIGPAVIDAASSAGANQISNIGFGLKEPEIYRGEAIAAATANAISDATALANAANLKLVRVLEISVDQARPFPRAEKIGMAFAAAPLGGNATPIEAGDVEITANVSVTYEISSK